MQIMKCETIKIRSEARFREYLETWHISSCIFLCCDSKKYSYYTERSIEYGITFATQPMNSLRKDHDCYFDYCIVPESPFRFYLGT